MEDSIKSILKAIDSAIEKFQDKIPGIQKIMYETLQPLIKNLEVKDGKLLNNVQNLKLIGELKNKLENIIINPEYKKSVNDFVDGFTAVSNLQQEYFKQFGQQYKAKKTLPIIKELAVESTINDLVGQGMSNNIIDPIRKILNENITTGGNYAKFQEQLRNHILTNDTGEGTLERYTKQITTDALHQYNAQYHDAIAQDLNFTWGRYVGSNITTSREFCILLTQLQWVNKKDLPVIIKGNIDGHKCKLSKTTGLPLGMIPDTNADNFKVRRGGYNCGHQFFWVPDSAVPEEIKNQKPVAVTESENKTVQKISEKNKHSIKSLKARGIEFPEEVMKHMHTDVSIVDRIDGGSYFKPSTGELVIGGMQRAQNDYYRKKIVLHEGGHAIHFNKKIITEKHVDPEFQEYYEKLQSVIKGKEGYLDDLLYTLGYANHKDLTKAEQISMLHDTLGGLTKGAHGDGHPRSYYRTGNFSLMEVFAHSITLAKLKNEFADADPVLKELTDLMKEYGLKILEGK